jgi:hypothetical protein
MEISEPHDPTSQGEYRNREREFLDRLRAWVRRRREDLAQMVRDGLISDSNATFLEWSLNEALFIAATVPEAEQDSIGPHCGSEEDREHFRTVLVTGLLVRAGQPD